MSPAPGSTLGPYEILAPLGAGGMGEVYRARDPRLAREVAIKVLPAERVRDENRRRRFLQEARAASALNHPNIVTIHEIDSVDGIDFIVMELVTGKTLDRLIPRQGMPLGEILRLAIPIADALARAHGAGIVHRDLKPAKVAVSADGTVKVLDFGLAKLLQGDGSEGEPEAVASESPTATALSRPGAVAGTAGYMSPEQASGGRVDARSDVFSLGALLYEMVTGQRAFSRSSVAETLAAVMKEQPKPPSGVVPGVPKELERVIQRCLRKEPERRFQHMLDVKVELQEIKEESDSAAAAPVTARRAGRARWIAAAAGLAAVLSVLGFSLARLREAPVPPARVEPLTGMRGLEDWPAWSPDGRQVAFTWGGEKGDNEDIYVKIVGSSEVHWLTTDAAVDTLPSWSPDGRLIAFLRCAGACTIHLVSPLGGGERRLGDLDVWGRPSWSPDGRWLAVSRQRPEGDTAPEAGGVILVPLEGGPPRQLAREPHAGEDRAPALSPDGRHLAYVSCVTRLPPLPCDVYVVELGPDLAPSGSPRRLTRQGYTVLGLDWARDGASIVYDTELGPGLFYLWRVGIDGSRPPERLEIAAAGAIHPAVAPVGRRLAFRRGGVDRDVARFPPGGASEAFLSSSYWDSSPSFSPDGRRIAFESARSGERLENWLAAADGTSPVQLTRGPGRWQGSPSWSPDGRRVAFDSQAENGRWDVWTIDVDGGVPQRLTRDPADENVPRWSRDGRWIYFTSERDGPRGIWRIPAGGGVEERLTRVGGFGVDESSDGRTLFYKSDWGASALLAHPLDGGPERTEIACTRGRFAVVGGSIYYAACEPGSAPALRRRDLGSGRDRRLGTLDRYAGLLAASPDEETILYGQYTPTAADLMLIENFR
jgi:Tol biopolymer transport system component/tRNA A-37 threonylcarbamoyl transferase component Bud32